MIDRDKLKPFFILFIFMLGVSLYFWMTSRYPDLGAKAALGGTAPLSGLGFAPLFDIKENAPLWEKLFYGTLNWMETNRRGMTFAFILGAFFLSMIPLVNIRKTKSAIGNSFVGLLMGAPLGLCVNCSAPVARSMYASGMRPEAALALLISSPTLNVVVLSMILTFFPFYLVVGKLFLTFLFVLVIVPLAFRFLFKREALRQTQKLNTDCQEEKCTLPEIKGWLHALKWCAQAYMRNFIRIVVMTGPLMILAGFAGTVLIHILPWGEVKDLGQSLQSPAMIILIMLVIAIIGALLPSPMAFDVAMSAFLLQAGVPIVYVAVFLFTLGTYSVYAFFIVWQAISLRVASFMFLMTVLLGLGLGAITIFFESYYLDKAIAETKAVVTSVSGDVSVPEDLDPIISRTDKSYSYAEIKKDTDALRVGYTPVKAIKNIDISWRPYASTQIVSSTLKPFERIFGEEMGIEQPYRVSYLSGIDIIPRITTSIATGDVHNDGWEDVLLLGDHEVTPNVILYSNIGGKGFKRQNVPDAADAVLVALADLNGDGWLDIVYATYAGKNYVIYNAEGEFLEKNRKQLGPDLPGTTNSMSFGDIDKNGSLEVYLGNWNVGPNFINNSKSRDVLLTHQGDEYISKEMPGATGETLSTLLWDFNDDGNLDIYIGNDFVIGLYSDLILLGDGKGNFNFPPDGFEKNFKGAQSTMSVDVGDFNNDQKPDFYLGQIAYLGQYIRKMSEISKRQIRFSEFCQREGLTEEKLKSCLKEMEFKLSLAAVNSNISDACAALPEGIERRMCDLHLQDKKNFCGEKPILFSGIGKEQDTSTRYRKMCQQYSQGLNEVFQNPITESVLKHHLRIANESRGNILLKAQNRTKQYEDATQGAGVAYGGWSWNSKFADLDNDGWQDIYITNGYPLTMSLGTKVFYHNKGDGKFEDKTVEYGLEDYSNTASYSYVDFDHDGDLDIIAAPLDGPVKIFRNLAGSKNKSIQIELRDEASKNVFAIGAIVKIGKQTKYIKASGGYKSFDAPVVAFGLGDEEKVSEISITWPDGKKDILKGDFQAGGRYMLTRHP